VGPWSRECIKQLREYNVGYIYIVVIFFFEGYIVVMFKFIKNIGSKKLFNPLVLLIMIGV